ncbi:MAG: EsaB/YukD family protein [Bacillota bacterium]|nr:EsaB/YukD family protein [Bacillota bacterium]MDW7676346.1 EsaB/YukD family protein [Bacillota bacterium]
MGKISLKILDSTENKEIEVRLPGAVPVKDILIQMAEKLELPAMGLKGNAISYALIHKTSGKRLSEKQTLEEAGVRDEDLLRLQAEIAAGK